MPCGCGGPPAGARERVTPEIPSGSGRPPPVVREPLTTQHTIGHARPGWRPLWISMPIRCRIGHGLPAGDRRCADVRDNRTRSDKGPGGSCACALYHHCEHERASRPMRHRSQRPIRTVILARASARRTHTTQRSRRRRTGEQSLVGIGHARGNCAPLCDRARNCGRIGHGRIAADTDVQTRDYREGSATRLHRRDASARLFTLRHAPGPRHTLRVSRPRVTPPAPAAHVQARHLARPRAAALAHGHEHVGPHVCDLRHAAAHVQARSGSARPPAGPTRRSEDRPVPAQTALVPSRFQPV